MIIYDLGNKNSVQKTSTIRALFGFKDKSYHGKYIYARQGLLSKIKYERLTKTVLLVEKKDQKRVVNIFKKMGIVPIVAPLRVS